MAVSKITLRNLPLFAGLDEASLEPIAAAAALRPIERHATVLLTGERTDNVYFVLRGSLKVLVSDDYGREVILSILGPGELFGEMGVIDDHPRSATVIAAQPSELVVISKEAFKRILAENFDLSLAIMRGLVHRLRSADRTIESLALLDVYGRVARLLLDMAETDAQGRKVVRKKISKQDIAKMIGASREMVSRVMKDLTQQRLIEESDGVLLLRVTAEACD